MIESTANPMLQEIERLSPLGSNKLIDRSKVIDGLLDLRLIALGSPQLLSTIDKMLRTAPGKSLVEAVWFNDMLVELSTLAEPAVATIG